mgnify:CR=1 FL=1
METTIRICQFFDIDTKNGPRRRYQNYFIGQNKTFGGQSYEFAPFQVQGGIASLNGDNEQMQVFFPASEYAIRLVEEGDGNRLSRLVIYTRYITAEGEIVDTTAGNTFDNYLVGIGATFSEDSIELRFRSALDGVTPNLPARRLSEVNVGILPLDSRLSLS